MPNIVKADDSNLTPEERAELIALARDAGVEVPEKLKEKPRRRQERQTSIDEFKEQVKKDEQSPLMTLLGYSQLAGQFQVDKEVTTTAMRMSGEVGRILSLLAKRRAGEKWTSAEEYDYIHSMGRLLFQLSAMCDHTFISLQKIAELSLTEMETAHIKRLHEPK